MELKAMDIEEDLSANRLIQLALYVEKLRNVCDDDPTNTSNDMGQNMHDLYRALIELTVRRKLMGSKNSF